MTHDDVWGRVDIPFWVYTYDETFQQITNFLRANR